MAETTVSSVKNFADNLLYIMEERCLNKSDISRLTGLSNSFVGGVLNEGGNISLEKAEKVAKSLHVELWIMVLPPKQAVRLIKAGRPKITPTVIKALVSSASEPPPSE